MALIVCLAAYGFLAAYAYHSMQQEQLEAKKMRLSALSQQQAELIRKQDLLKKARLFNEQVTAFHLNPQTWLFYDVNVQGQFRYEAAQLVIQQCSDSELAYYLPISLEINNIDTAVRNNRPEVDQAERKDVQLRVKGKFVARK